eukprot:COSAG04_NODE_3269_length_2991_cov_2.786653_1_plen_368_part_10
MNYHGSGGYYCDRASDGTDNSVCASELALTVTRGAYYDEDGRLVYGTPFDDGIVGAEETGTIVLPRAEAERLVPQFTLEQMMVQGSAAHDALAAQLTARQLSHLAFPLSVADPSAESGRRRAQANGGGAGAQQANSVAVMVRAQAPTQEEASSAVQAAVERSGGTVDPSGVALSQVVLDRGGATLGRRLEGNATDEELAASSAHRRAQANGGGGGAQQANSVTVTVATCTITLSKAEAVATVEALWQQTPTQERIMIAPPTLDEMLVGESAASGMLSSLFVVEQQPHTVRPLSIELVDPGSGHRRVQANGGGGGGAQQGNSVAVTVAARAPTPAEARRTLQEIQVQVDSGAYRSTPVPAPAPAPAPAP